jgi:hypothetical protein
MQCEEHKRPGDLMISPAEPGLGDDPCPSLCSVGHSQTSDLARRMRLYAYSGSCDQQLAQWLGS